MIALIAPADLAARVPDTRAATFPTISATNSRRRFGARASHRIARTFAHCRRRIHRILRRQPISKRKPCSGTAAIRAALAAYRLSNRLARFSPERRALADGRSCGNTHVRRLDMARRRRPTNSNQSQARFFGVVGTAHDGSRRCAGRRAQRRRGDSSWSTRIPSCRP